MQTVNSLSAEEKQTWRMIRKELEDVGVTVAVFEANKDFIVDWFVKAVTTGAFTEIAPRDAREIVVLSNTLSNSFEVAPVVDLEITPRSSPFSPTDNGSQARADELNSNHVTKLPNTYAISGGTFEIPPPASPSDPAESVPWTHTNESNISRVTELPDTYAMPGRPIAGLDLYQPTSKVADKIIARTRLAMFSLAVIGTTTKDLANLDVVTKNEGLILASLVGNEEVATLLIKCGADVNSKSAIKRTALHEALYEPNLSFVTLLISHGAKVDVKDLYGWTPMSIALLKAGTTHNDFQNYMPIILALVEAGIDVNYHHQLENGESALTIAFRLGNIEAAEALLARGANANVVGKNRSGQQEALISQAVGTLNVDMAELLLHAGADPNGLGDNGLSLLHLAVRRQNPSSLKMTELLLDAGADVDTLTPSGNVPLQDGLRRGNMGVCVPVLMSRVWMGLATGPPYRLDDLGPVEQYERAYWNRWVQASEDSPLHLAVFHENIEQVKLLLDAGANVNVRGAKTSLYWPVDRRSSSKTTQTLPNFEFAPNWGDSPLHLAVLQGNIKLVELLLNAGADTNVCGVKNRTPLHMTVADCMDHFWKKEMNRYQFHTQLANVNYVEMVRFLLDAGANVNESDTNGWSSLHWASYHGLTNVAQILLRAGADVNAETLLGETSLSLAYNEYVKSVLLKHGANPITRPA